MNGRPLTQRQIEQRRAAGKASYRKMVARAVEHMRTEDGSVLVDQVAMYVSCFRLNRGFRRRNGLTSGYIVSFCAQCGIDLGPRPRLW